jgi:hypothetical protein
MNAARNPVKVPGTFLAYARSIPNSFTHAESIPNSFYMLPVLAMLNISNRSAIARTKGI